MILFESLDNVGPKESNGERLGFGVMWQVEVERGQVMVRVSFENFDDDDEALGRDVAA